MNGEQKMPAAGSRATRSGWPASCTMRRRTEFEGGTIKTNHRRKKSPLWRALETIEKK